MKTYHLKKTIFFLTLLGSSHASWAACNQTLSPGANVASAVSSAANGSTICLNSGNYGSVNFYDMARTGYVTVTSTTGTGAIMSPKVGNSDYIRFDRMSLSSMQINNGSTNIQIANSTFLPNKTGLAVIASSKILVDNVDFTSVNQATWSGRVSLNNASYTTITNSKFVGVGKDSSNVKVGAADGIMIIGQASNNTIGPNNLFADILQSVCDVANPGSHCDSIQFYGGGPGNVITGNHFVNDNIFIMAPDGVDKVTVTNNVFNGDAFPTYDWKIQFGSANGVVFEHNTLTNTGVTFDSKPGNSASTNISAKNNIIKDKSIKTTGGSGCTPNCVFNYNTFGSSGSAIGSSNLIGIPTFTGGTKPTAFSGYKLTSSSIGYLKATDGKDMGTSYYGSGAITTPSDTTTTPSGTTTLAAPTNLRLN
jgi:hypothetical protein